MSWSTAFCVIWATINHFETCLMVLSQKVESQLVRMASELKICLLGKKENGDTPALKILVFASDHEF